MARVPCAVCRKDGDSRDMYYCSKWNLWIHFNCAGGSLGLAGVFGSDPNCPNCGNKLSK